MTKNTGAMASLIDVNVLIALMHERHQHARTAVAWVGGRTENNSILICRIVQMGALRILSNPAIMQEDVLSATDFWRGWDAMMGDDRFVFVQEPQGFESEWRATAQTLPKRQRIETNVYLASLAKAGKWTMTTFDKGFKRFPGLQLEVLGK